MNGFVGASHPHVWKFISVISEEEVLQAIRYLKLKDGKLRERARRAEDDKRDLDILRLKNEYLRNKMNVMEYLKQMAELRPNCDEFKV